MQNKLKEILSKRGISALELSRRTGIERSVIYNIGNGKIAPYDGWKKRIAEALDMPVIEIFPEKEAR